MADVKSYGEFISGLYDALLKDCASRYPAIAKEFEKDKIHLSSVLEHHGVRFFMDTMPSWRKHFDQCLALGRLTPSHLRHFGSWKKEGTVPRLFRGLVLRVFEYDGELKPEPDVQAIRLVRQLLGAVKRFRVNCADSARWEAVADFIRTDDLVVLGTLDWGSDDDFSDEEVQRLSFTDGCQASPVVEPDVSQEPVISGLLYGHAERIQQVADYVTAHLGTFDPTTSRFRHGPGAVSDQKFGAHKYAFRNWPDRLGRVFPPEEFAVANYSGWFDSPLYKSSDAVTQKEWPSKLLAVPKTIKTPRLIAAEPTSLQWCQQSVRDFLYTRVAESPIRAFIDFRRQELNGDLAREASSSGRHCTIDLSSASDRVSCWHVERLFRRSPSLLNALRASRSLRIEQVIDRRQPQYILLRKFSTMGNATTFPVQSLFFLVVILGTICYRRGLRVNDETMTVLGSEKVRVFGDDLIVPADVAQDVVGILHTLGLKVNTDKTFLSGKFRESCGVDAYDGQDVTSVSILDIPNMAKPGSIVSSVDVHNNLCDRGWFETAAYVQKTTICAGGRNIASITHGSGAFGWKPNYVLLPTPCRTKWGRETHVRLTRCLQLNVGTTVSASEGEPALLQFFTEAAKVVRSGFSTLHYHERRAKTKLRLGWVSLT